MNATITTKDRLDHFSDSYDIAAQYFSTLNPEGKESVKKGLMTALNNFCDRLDTVEGLTGQSFSDPYTSIGRHLVGALAKKDMLSNFSNDLGGIQSTNISALIIGSYYQSYGLSYISKLEGMTSPKTIYNIQQLAAFNDFGFFQKDDIVLDPRQSMYPAAQLTGSQVNVFTKETTANTLETINFNGPIRINSITMYVQDTTTEEWLPVGHDKADGYQKGKIYSKLSGAKSIAVDYLAGTITPDTPTAIDGINKIRFEATYDNTKDKDQSHVPTLYGRNEPIELNSMSHQFTIRQNLEDIVHMNKEYAYNKPMGVASNYAKNTLAQLMSFYTRSIDTNIMRTLVEPYLPYLSSVREENAFNLAGWTAAGNMNLFEGRMYELFAHLDVTMSNETDGRRPTCIVVDSVGATNLMTNRFFVKQGAGESSSDGFIGTLYGLPVIKSRVLDWYGQERYKNLPNGSVNALNIYEKLKTNLSVDTSAGEAVSIGFVIHKSPDNKEAPVITGDYIVPWATSAVISNGGTIIEHSILCEYANKLMLPKLAIPIVMKVSSHPGFILPEIKVY